MITRRNFLGVIAGGVALAGSAPAHALAPPLVRDARIKKLIGEAAHLPAVSQRIEFISKALLGSPYRGYMLIGGPRVKEQFVVRDDAFDCVTFCETVMAAAQARDAAHFAEQLRLIRYKDGEVDWQARNHYFSTWCANNVANNLCKPLMIPGHETVDKRLTHMRALGPRKAAYVTVPREALLDHRMLLSTGDIIGFVSQRPGLDYFHTGFIVVADDGALSLRHAAKSRGRVLDQPLPRFLRETRAEAVTLLRVREPEERSAVS